MTTLFSDVADDPSRPYINKAVESGIITGYADGTFQSENPVIRGQFVAVFWRAAGKPAPTKAPRSRTCRVGTSIIMTRWPGPAKTATSTA